MVTKDQSDSSSSGQDSPVITRNENDNEVVQNEQPGFFGMLIKSIFEPGANPAAVLAMNLCFFFLLLTLTALAILTGFNKHVLILLGVTGVLWASMMWFVMELTKVQNRPDNMPPSLIDLDTSIAPDQSGSRTDAVLEKRKDQ